MWLAANSFVDASETHQSTITPSSTGSERSVLGGGPVVTHAGPSTGVIAQRDRRGQKERECGIALARGEAKTRASGRPAREDRAGNLETAHPAVGSSAVAPEPTLPAHRRGPERTGSLPSGVCLKA